MKVNRKQLVEVITADILKNLSFKIREMVAYEIDIERKRLRRQILEEIRESYGNNGNGNDTLREAMEPKRKPFQNVVPQKNLVPTKPKRNLTGSPEIDSILNEIREDDEAPTSFHDLGDGFGQPMVSPEEPTDIANFDPKKHDPTQIDYSAMMEAVDQRAREKRKEGGVMLPM